MPIDADDRRCVALYWDFENLHAGLFEARHGEGAYARPDGRFKAQEPLVNVQAVLDLAATFGPVAVARAYGNWQFYGRYRDVLLSSAMELVQMFPPGATAKNGADIRLALDALDDLGRYPHIATVVVISGDSDFIPLAQKIRAAGRRLVGVGLHAHTNPHWANQCHEFRYYDGLPAVETLARAHALPGPAAPAPGPVDR